VSIGVQAGTALALERFWKWLKDHSNCILRAGTQDCYLYDQDELHWHLGEGPDRNLWVQVMSGKQLVSELVIETASVLFVQAAPDTETDEPGRFLFELVGGPKDEAYPLYHFLMAHGFDDATNQHGPLKH